MSTGLRAGTNNDGYLQVNGTDVLTALSSGNLGVGTTSPSAPLEVVGIIKSSDPAGHYTQVGADGQIELVRVSGNGPYIDFKNLANEDYDCRIQQSNDGLQFWTGGNGSTSARLIVTNTGILEIDRGSQEDQAIDIKTTSTTGASRIRFVESGTSNGEIAYSHNNNQLELIARSGKSVVMFSNDTERFRLHTDGSTYRGGNVITEADMNWGHDTYQRPHIFTGDIGGLPGDAALVLATPTADPSNVRIGSIVFGCAVSGGVTSNPGIKTAIESRTNTNVATAGDTGAYLVFSVKPDNGNVTEAARITSSGELNLGPTDSFAAKLTIKSDASTTRQVKLLSNNTDWGWGIDTIDLFGGNVPLRIFQRWSFNNTIYERQAVKIAQANNGATGVVRLAINDTSTSVPTQTFTIREDVSAGYGATLALQNKGGSVNDTATAILFGVDTSDTNVPGSADTANATITVTNSGVSNDADMRFWVHTGSGGNKESIKIVGDGNNRASAGTAIGEACRGGVAFGNAGFAIDRSWGNYPGFHTFHQNVDGDTNQGEIRFHGWNTTFASYPEPSGGDFSVNLRIDGGTYHSSDRRHKTNIVDNPYGLEEILQLQPRKFNRISSDGSIEESQGDILGFIAQEVIEVIPEAVKYYADEDEPNENGWCRAYSLSPEYIVSTLVSAMKELSAKNDALEARIAALEG